MADLIVTEQLRAYLIAQGVVQTNDHTVAAPSPTIPSVFIIGLDGVPGAPRDGENITVTLRDTLAAPAGSLEAWVIDTFVDVIVRSRTDPEGELLQRQIADLLHPRDAHGGRVQWTMGSLLVGCSKFWRGDQRLPSAGTGVRSVGEPAAPTYDRVQSFVISARRKALAGLPTVP